MNVIDFAAISATPLQYEPYEHMVVPDHAPGHQDPENRRQGFAFDFGYIKAMIQAVMDED